MIPSPYFDKNRFYHNDKHIESMLDYVGSNASEELKLAILYHDVVYDPYATDNEEKSVIYFKEKAKEIGYSDSVIARVEQLILVTKHPFDICDDEEINEIRRADLYVFSDTYNLLSYEQNTFKEYQKTDINVYRKERINFLSKAKFYFEYTYGELNFRVRNCQFLIDYVFNHVYKVGIYAGSFNPYHIGHEDIALQAEQVFDKVILAQGYNRDKQNTEHLLFHKYRQVKQYQGLLSDLFDEENKIEKYLVRGIRNSFDIVAERNLLSTIQDIDKNIKPMYFFCSKEHEHISSSMIRGLYEFGKDVYGKYLGE